MNIDFESIEPVSIPGFKGGEGTTVASMYVNMPLGKVMHGHLEPGSSIGMHTHETSSEVVYILDGEGVMHFDGGIEPLAPGTVSYCPQGHTHSMVNTGSGNLEFLAVVPEHVDPQRAFEDGVRARYRLLTEKLIERGLQITTMESCTAGQIASLLTDTEG